MIIAAYLHIKAFSHVEFMQRHNITNIDDGSRASEPTTELKTRVWPAMKDALSPLDIFRDITGAPRAVRDHRRRKKAKQQMRELEQYNQEFDDEDIDPAVVGMVDVEEGERMRSNYASLRGSVDFKSLDAGMTLK
jgi:hypothetical protein